MWGTEQEADRAIAYLRSRAEGGVSWTTLAGRLGNILISGFEPSVISAETKDHFRLPMYHERISAYVDAVHGAGALAAQQLPMEEILDDAAWTCDSVSGDGCCATG